MKKLLLTLSALAVLSLLAPATGMAYNVIGFYNDMNLSASQIDGYTGVPANVYVFVHDCYDVINDRAVENIGGFEFKVVMPAGAFILSIAVPVNYLNVGAGIGEFIVGFGSPISVNSGVPSLILTMNILASSQPDQALYVSTTESPAGLQGLIQILDYDTNAEIPIVPNTNGDRTVPIFVFNPSGNVVDVEDVTFDTVKALYR